MIQQIKSLECLCENNNSNYAIIVLHGFGANCHDLWPIKDVIPNKEKFDWYFPNAPMEIPIGFGQMGRAWFPITMSEFEIALQQGQFEKVFEDKLPEGFQFATEKVIELVEHLKENHERVYLGGFSQGSMVSVNVTLQKPDLIHRLFILSGTLVSKNNWQSWIEGAKQIPTLQTHGVQDPVLPFAQAEKLNELFAKKPDHNFIPFQGGHEIPMPVIEKLGEFLNVD